jgi:hypothetical protein
MIGFQNTTPEAFLFGLRRSLTAAAHNASAIGYAEVAGFKPAIGAYAATPIDDPMQTGITYEMKLGSSSEIKQIWHWP